MHLLKMIRISSVLQEQIEEEFKGVLNLILEVYKDFGILTDTKFRLSLRDKNDKEKYFDDDEMWNSGRKCFKKSINRFKCYILSKQKVKRLSMDQNLDILIKPVQLVMK